MKTEIHDAVFGLLKQDKDFPHYYRSTLQFSAIEPVEFTLNLETTGKDLQNMSVADWAAIFHDTHKIFASLQAQESILRQSLAAHHLSVAYDWWNTPEEPVALNDFVSRLVLFGLSISAGDDPFYADQAVQLDYKVQHQFGSYYLYAATNAQIQLTDTEFRM